MTRAVVVDDDAASARLAHRILTQLGIEQVDTAGGGEAYDRLVATHGGYDLLLLDIRLGAGESGLDLAARTLTPEGPAVVMVSGIDDPEVFSQAVALGAHGYVLKPYRASELKISALNALRRRELEQQALAHQQQLTALVDARTAELRQTLTELERVQRVREEMLANCSHELKTPLTPILGWASYLVRRPDVAPEQVRSCAAVIAEQGRRLLGVVDTLLAASAVAGGSSVVPGLVCDATAAVRAAAAGRDGLTVVAPSTPLEVPLGEMGLAVVLAQLLDNAARFAPGSPVSLELVDTADGVTLSVVDHGPGLPADRSRAELLESFVQGDGSSTRAVGGLGVGLYVVSGLVRAHNGELRLEDTPGGGLTVVVRLPRVRP